MMVSKRWNTDNIRKRGIILTPKLRKNATEKERIKARIADLQAKLTESEQTLSALEQERQELENAEIIRSMRTMSIPFEEVAAFLTSFRANPTIQSPAAYLIERQEPEDDEE